MTDHSATPDPVAAWHGLVAHPDRDGLDRLLAEEIEFRSPAVHSPKTGRDAAGTYLWAALTVLGPSLRYTRQWDAPHSAVLEFEAEITGDDGRPRTAQGVDVVSWDDTGRLTEFTVMVRPRQALDALIARMGEALADGASR